MGDIRTGTDRHRSWWGFDDAVVRLRRWGSDKVWRLPTPPQDMTIGTSADCEIRLDDRLVSREHVRLTHVDGRWFAFDLRSKNGVYLDGAPTNMLVLAPGSEIRTGETTLVVETASMIELRVFVARILGWSSDRLEMVDRALRAIRRAAMRRSVLYLVGDMDLVPVAHSLHRLVLGSDRPFVTCDPRRGEVRETARSAANKPDGFTACAAALGGTVCVRTERPPPDLDALLYRHAAAETSRVQLTIVGHECRARNDADIASNPAIHVPPVLERLDEIPMVVDHYARDAAEELLLPLSMFGSEDRAWVLRYAATSLAEIEKATLRLIALRGSRTLSDAASRLQIAPVSLTRWLGRRALPPSLAHKLRAPEQ